MRSRRVSRSVVVSFVFGVLLFCAMPSSADSLDALRADVASTVALINAANPPGANGLIAKLTGNGGVIAKAKAAADAYAAGTIDEATYRAMLEDATSMLDAVANQLAANIRNGHIVEPYASQLQALLLAMRRDLQALITCPSVPEVCDGVDNNCNGSVDEVPTNVGAACQQGVGVCMEPGVTVCQNGLIVCNAVPGQPVPEVCDGLDNNCNGISDDGNPGSGQACGTGLPGACAAGTTNCTNGSLTCTPNVHGLEVCDGLDNDCNGTVDDVAGPACVAHVVFNEVESSGGSPGDWVELVNSGTATANVSGWRFLDNDDAHTPYVIPSGTSIVVGGRLLLEEVAFGFGLGAADSARLFDASGVPVDSYSWTSHAVTTYGRCPDGTGAFRTTTSSTKGAANDCSVPVKINEVESSGGFPGDWVEVYNAGPVVVDMSAWIFKDNDDTHAYVIPAGTTIAPGAYYMLEEAAFGFGLGAADSARLYDALGTLVDSYAWTAHAATTYGRCPNGTGAFTTTASPTKGAANTCGGGGSTAAVWPGSNAVTTVDGVSVFGGNLSDLFYESTASNVLWAVRNGPSTLYRLVWNGTIWTPETANGWDTGKTLRYRNGTGGPDAEGVTKAELSSSAVYVATERDNDVSTLSRMNILRFDTAAAGTELIATHEWNLTSDLPPVGSNLGLEAITWIPDTFLVANSFFDERAGRTYVPADYPNHGTGLFFVGLEANGVIYAYALDHVGGGFSRVATIVSGDVTVKGLAFDREVGYLWTMCGSACGNQTSVLTIDSTGKLKVRRQFARPTTMANIGNEGIAIAPESQCASGFKPFYWTDDGETSGHAIRADTIPCGAFIP